MWHNLVRSFHLGFLPYIYLFYLLSRPSSAYLLLSHVSPTFCLIIIPSSHLGYFLKAAYGDLRAEEKSWSSFREDI